MDVILIVNVTMEIVMNKLTYDGLKEVYDGEKNLGGKPIFISFKADW